MNHIGSVNILSVLICILLLLTTKNDLVNGAGSILTENWKFHFLGSSNMGIFLALALPLENGRNTFLALNFEANYHLPDERVDYEYPPLIGRRGKGFDRQFVYDAIEAKMEMYGYPGKKCLLRTICEASEESLQQNGVLGDILHIIFTPSTSHDNITDDYEHAERKGREKNCQEYNKNCTISFLDMVTWIGQAL